MIHETNNDRWPVFFGREQRLFGWLHDSDDAPARRPVVICSPIGYEQVRTYATVRALAEVLARQGHTVLRFDYPSTGDSLDISSGAGHFETWLASIREAIDFVSQHGRAQGVSLIGLRLGGTLAWRIAEQQPVDELILWEPPESGKVFCREMQIVAAAAKPGKPGPDTPDGIDAGGFLITPETQESLRTLSVGEKPLNGAPAILLLEREDLRRNERRAKSIGEHDSSLHRQPAVGYKQMMLAPQESLLPTKTIDYISAWLQQRQRGEISASRSAVPYIATRTDAGISEQALRFGPDNRLFGILSRGGNGKQGKRPTIITLCGGAVPHYSANRMYVPLARRLSGLGYDVLRMSLAGIGDSDAAPDGPINTAYTATTTEDIQSAIDTLGELTGCTTFSLLGLCSGAYAAMRFTQESRAIADLILINQLVYFVSEDEIRRLADGDIRSGHALDFPRSAAFTSRLMVKTLKTLGNSGSWLGQLLQYPLIRGKLSQELRRVADSGVHMAFVHSDNDPARHALLLPARRCIRQLIQSGRATEVVVAHTDHTFSPAASQKYLVDWVAQFLEDRHATGR